MVNRQLIITGSLLGALAVMLGAFGAHSLTNYLSLSELQTFHTANRYHFYHVFAIFFAWLLYEKTKSKLVKLSGYAFLVGIVLFSGSLYLLAAKSLLQIENWTFLGQATPVGGLSFIIGWLLILAGFLKMRQ